MTKLFAQLAGLKACATLAFVTLATAGLAAQWPEWRGPHREGRSLEMKLPSSWSPSGENLAWRIPIGGRATPVAFQNRIYLLTTVGDFTTTQERLVAIDADSGKVLWDRRFSQYLSDVPQNRAAWAPPAVDEDTGNIYVFTVSAELTAVSPDNKILWTRSLPEEYGAITTHGGRTTSPIIEDDKVILNSLIHAWGSDLGRPGNRYFAFDKRTGQTIWVSSPQTRHYDTNYSTPVVVTVPDADPKGSRHLIVGGTDGQFYGLKANTGEKVWQVDVSKRAILNSAIYRDGVVYITHGEENIGTTEMGMVAAVDATKTGQLGKDAFKWIAHGFLPTFSSPTLDTERLYSVDNGAIVAAFDLKTGKQLWHRSLGTLQKGSPVLADGKLYVGTENGKVFILEPSATGVKVLDEDQLPIGAGGTTEVIVASPIVADGRVYITSMDAMYAIGPKNRRSEVRRSEGSGVRSSGSTDPVAHVQVFPHEATLEPGGKTAYSLKLFDAKGNLVRTEKGAAATWALEGGLGGAVSADGTYTAPAGGSLSQSPAGSAGFVKATIGGVSGTARVRVIEPLPWSFDFESAPAEGNGPPPGNWIGASGKVQLRTVANLGKVLVRPRDETVGRRAKVIFGRPDSSGLTVEADVRGRVERRQRGDIGLINQRYVMTLFGNAQKLELQPWQAADEMTVRIENFAWDPDKWYRMKLRVDNLQNGAVHVRGKVWPAGEPEPAAWTIEKMDKIGHRHGAPGLYGDGISEIYFDNVKVIRNQ